MSGLREIYSDAREELSDAMENRGPGFRPEFYSDLIDEIADSAVPIYTGELMELASDPDIIYRDDELGGETLVDQVRGRVYCAISAHLHSEIDEIAEEIFAECPSCLDEKLITELEGNPDALWCDDCTESREDDEDDEPEYFDSENIYNLPSIRQSIEEDRK